MKFKMAFLLNSLKLFLISTWLLFTALGLNLSLSTITHFFATHVPLTWNLCLTCLRPPYLFLLLNAIILSIAASSRFHHPAPPPPQPLPPAYVIKPPPSPPLLTIEDNPPALVDVKPVVVNGVAVEEEEDGTLTMESTWTPPEKTPPAPAPTLEEVWKTITEGRARAVKRSETMNDRRRKNRMVCAATTGVKKSEPQELSQDELNRRAEAFIRKFNGEMRLQKQQSLNRWLRADGDCQPRQ